eukprot:753500-Hanusia_phi.AAC.1
MSGTNFVWGKSDTPIRQCVCVSESENPVGSIQNNVVHEAKIVKGHREETWFMLAATNREEVSWRLIATRDSWTEV